MSAKNSPQLHDANGPLSLGRILGKGGEGSVYELENKPDIVAKLYHNSISIEKATKIEAMAAMRSERLLSLAAWPLGLIRSSGGQPCGLLMPKVSGHKDIHQLYSPRSRKIEFPNVDWRFLVRSAANTARAFAAIHEAGCVIGDVNHGGVTVSDKATIKLIDCDSFQVSARGQKFLCEVGVPTFTPPELQGRPFKGIERSANHDNFGLAVLIFHLLYMGRHPFAGRFLGRGEMPIEKAIAEFRFVYGSNNSAVQMEPPPNMPKIAAASQPVALLLERAFLNGANSIGRPTAIEWITVLDALEKNLVQCRVNASHHYFSGLQYCPWCHTEAATGVILFSLYIKNQASSGSAFYIAIAWSRISSIAAPGPSPELIGRDQFHSMKSCDEAVQAGGGSALRMLGIFLVVAAGVGLCVVAPKAWLVWLICGFFIGKAVGSKNSDSAEMQKFIDAHRSAENRYWDIKSRWESEATESKYLSKLRELDNYRNQWKELPNVRQRRYRKLEQERERAQRKRFLEQFTIEGATISGIGPGRKAMLESYNVETAWDIAERNVTQVPGFGPVLTEKLQEWCLSVERKFRFDPSKGVDPRDTAALDREIADTRRKIEQHILTGPTELTQIKNSILAQRASLLPQINDALRGLAQAEMDLSAARR